MQQIAEPLGRDHPDLGTGMRQNDVRSHGRAVQQVVDLRQRHASLSAKPADNLHRAARRIIRRRRNLVDRDLARILINQNQISERTANINADPLHPYFTSRLVPLVRGAAS